MSYSLDCVVYLGSDEIKNKKFTKPSIRRGGTHIIYWISLWVVALNLINISKKTNEKYKIKVVNLTIHWTISCESEITKDQLLLCRPHLKYNTCRGIIKHYFTFYFSFLLHYNLFFYLIFLLSVVIHILFLIFFWFINTNDCINICIFYYKSRESKEKIV